MTVVTFPRVLPLKLKEADSTQCFYAIQTLMAIFFELDTCPACDRQECLQKQLHGMVEEPLHCLFNDLFFVKVMNAVAFSIGLLMLVYPGLSSNRIALGHIYAKDTYS